MADDISAVWARDLSLDTVRLLKASLSPVYKYNPAHSLAPPSVDLPAMSSIAQPSPSASRFLPNPKTVAVRAIVIMFSPLTYLPLVLDRRLPFQVSYAVGSVLL